MSNVKRQFRPMSKIWLDGVAMLTGIRMAHRSLSMKGSDEATRRLGNYQSVEKNVAASANSICILSFFKDEDECQAVRTHPTQPGYAWNQGVRRVTAMKTLGGASQRKMTSIDSNSDQHLRPISNLFAPIRS